MFHCSLVLVLLCLYHMINCSSDYTLWVVTTNTARPGAFWNDLGIHVSKVLHKHNTFNHIRID